MREGASPGPSHPWLDREVGLVGALVGTAGWGRAEPPAARALGEQGPCLKPGGGVGAGVAGVGLLNAPFSLLSAGRQPESPLDVARMTQLPWAAQAR